MINSIPKLVIIVYPLAGCLDIDRGWQRSQYLSGCNNDLTSKQIVDWTCPTYAYHDCLVEIEPWDGVVAESQE